MKSEEVVARRPDTLTLRRLDNWCHRNVFGEDKAFPGRGKERDFTEHEAQIAVVIGAVAAALERWSGGRGGAVALYRSIAQHMRDGHTLIAIHLDDGIDLTIDTDVIL